MQTRPLHIIPVNKLTLLTGPCVCVTGSASFLGYLGTRARCAQNIPRCQALVGISPSA